LHTKYEVLLSLVALSTENHWHYLQNQLNLATLLGKLVFIFCPFPIEKYSSAFSPECPKFPYRANDAAATIAQNHSCDNRVISFKCGYFFDNFPKPNNKTPNYVNLVCTKSVLIME
jgi:hypothetical protein